MALRIKISLLLLLFLLISSLASGKAEGFNTKADLVYSLHKGAVQMNSRKLLPIDMMDYDDTGPNHKHDPRRGPGGGAKNP